MRTNLNELISQIEELSKENISLKNENVILKLSSNCFEALYSWFSEYVPDEILKESERLTNKHNEAKELIEGYNADNKTAEKTINKFLEDGGFKKLLKEKGIINS